MSNAANQKTYKHASHEGVRVGWECLIEPRHLIAAGFKRDALRTDRRHLTVNGTVPDFGAFCKAIGYTTSMYWLVKRGARNPTDTFRVRVARALNLPEDELFRRVYEGE